MGRFLESMKKFVVFGMARTGSTLLVSLLNAHPQIRCEGELFRLGRWPTILQPVARIWQRLPLSYLVYRQARSLLLTRKTVYGFKLIGRAQIADTPGFIRFVSQNGWKIIHLERRSLFDQAISGQVGNQTGRYFGQNQSPEPVMSVTIPPDNFRTTMSRMINTSRDNRRLLADIPHLTLTYEDDLAQNGCWATTMARVCQFLDVATPAFVKAGVSKPWSRPYSEIVTNYAELVELARRLETDA